MNSDCVEGLITAYVECFPTVESLLYGTFTMCFCLTGSMLYNLWREPIANVYVTVAKILVTMMTLNSFIGWAIERMRMRNEINRVQRLLMEERNYIARQEMIARRQAVVLQQPTREDPTGSSTQSALVASNVSRYITRSVTDITRKSRDSSKTASTAYASNRNPQSVPKFKTIARPVQAPVDLFQSVPEFKTILRPVQAPVDRLKSVYINIPETVTGGEARSRRSQTQNPASQRQLRIPHTSSTPVAASGSRQPAGKKKKGPVPQMNVPGVSPILNVELRRRTRSSTREYSIVDLE